MLRVVLDTNVLVSARKSRFGASNELLRRVFEGEMTLIASIALFAEYEAVLKRPEHLLGSSLKTSTVDAFLDLVASYVEEANIHYMWRPQLNDPKDEMVLETAINGRADRIVTFNERHFAGAAERFGIAVITPGSLLSELT